MEKVKINPEEKLDINIENNTNGSLHLGNKAKTIEETIDQAKQICFQPVQVIGVQSATPVAWSPKGDLLAFVSRNNSIYICKVLHNDDDSELKVEMLYLFNGHRHEIVFVSFHPKDTNVLVSGGQDGIVVWDINSQKVDKILNYENEPKGHESDVLCCCWLFEGRVLVTGGKDANVVVWDMDKGMKCIETLYGHKAPVLSIAFCEKLRVLYTAGRDSTIKKWDMHSLDPKVIRKRDDDGSIACGLMANLDGHRGDVVTLTANESGKILLSGARDNTIKVWDMVMNREIRTIAGHGADVRRIEYFGEEQYIYTASLDGTIKLWKLLQEEMAMANILTEEDIEKDREAADKKALDEILYGKAASADALVERTVLPRDELMTTIRAHDTDVFAMEVNPAFPLMVTSSVHEIKIWNITQIAQPRQVQYYVGHSDAVTAIAFTKDDQCLLSASEDYNINQYDIASVERKAKFRMTGSVLSMALSPTDDMLYGAGNDYTIRGYDINEIDGETKALCEGHCGRVYCLAISPDGKMMVSGAHDYSICVWNLAKKSTTYKPKQTIRAHEGHVLGLSFSDPDAGQLMLASCSNDHSIKVWNVKGQKLSLKWTISDAHVSVVSCVAWGQGASSTALFSGGWDQSIKVWAPSSHAPKAPTEILNAHNGRITEVETTKNGLVLVSVSADGTALCWNAVQPYTVLCCYVGAFTDGAVCSLNVGNSLFATGFEDGIIKVWPLVCTDNESKHAQLFLTQEAYKSKMSKDSKLLRISGVP